MKAAHARTPGSLIGISGAVLMTLGFVLPHLSNVVAAALFDLGALSAVSSLILCIVELKERKRHDI